MEQNCGNGEKCCGKREKGGEFITEDVLIVEKIVKIEKVEQMEQITMERWKNVEQ